MELTYPEVGATVRGERPAGYRHLEVATLVGHGDACWRAADAAVRDFRMHRSAGVRVTSSEPVATVGATVTTRLGFLDAPCRVVWASPAGDPPSDGALSPAGTAPDLAGFAYGTLPGHPASGEEAFLVTRDPDGAVWFTVRAFSRPATWYTRLGGPIVPVFQRLYARRLGATLRTLAAS